MQVAKITWNEIRHDMTPAVGQDFIAAGKAIHDEMHFRGLISLMDKIGSRFDSSHAHNQSIEDAAVVL